MPVHMKVVRGVRKDGEMGLGPAKNDGASRSEFLKLAMLSL